MTQGQNLDRWRYLTKLVFFAVGVFSLYVATLSVSEIQGDYFLYQRVSSWSSTQGIMTDNITWSCPNRQRTRYGDDQKDHFEYIRYTFTVLSTTYYGDRYSQNSLCSLNLPERHDFTASHVKGLGVHVLYNPANPNESFLANSPISYQEFGSVVLYAAIAFFLIRGGVYT